MPMVLGKDQEKCSLIIATGESGWKDKADYECIDQCLHLTPIDKPKHAHARKEGGLCKAGTAKNSIKVWPLGKIKDGMRIDRPDKVEEGKFFPFAVLASRLFGLRNPCVPFDPADIYAPRMPCEPKKPYEGMTRLWEVEIDLLKAGLMGEENGEKITDKEFLNWAWLVEIPKDCTTSHTENYFFKQKYSHYEPQDRMIDDYLRHLVKSDNHYDYDKLYEVDLLEKCMSPRGKVKCPLPRQPREDADMYVKRLQSWHPVIRATKPMLKLAHLTDTHVNVRHDILASSEARMIDDVSEHTVGDKVMQAFWAFKELIEEMAKKKKGVDTALLLTGDYIDFNRNINPRALEPGVEECKARENNEKELEAQGCKVQGDDAKNSETKKSGIKIGEQWKAFNILANKDVRGMYERGLDDTLVYSLVRDAYKTHKMPVFMINGNHEGYRLPYGISARVGWWAIWLAILEGLKLLPELYKKAFIGWGSQWKKRKGDERMSADHNLTMYEATLAYGPTYAQTPTSSNFDAGQFDWFHMLFTPFSDVVLVLGGDADDVNGKDTQQILALLGWGSDETLLNLLDWPPLGGVDAQGKGILPRASQSFSKNQKLLLERAKALKDSKKIPFVVVSHFPMVSYHLLTAFNEAIAFTPWDSATSLPFPRVGEDGAAFNKANEGTCEQNQHWFYKEMVSYAKANTNAYADANANAIDWHISGHSHRAGVYHVGKVVGSEDVPKLQIESAHDPDLQRDKNKFSWKGTYFVVSGSAGPLGKQNLEGEFGGWLTRPPSGSLIDVKNNTIEQVKVVRENMNESPRLCVILDYMAVMKEGKDKNGNDTDIVPIQFAKSHVSFEEIKFTLSEEMAERNCLYLNGMIIWLFQLAKKGSADLGNWISISGSVTKGKKSEKGRTEYTLDLSDTKIFKICDASPIKFVPQAFCKIPMNELDSKNIAGSDDINCDDPWIFPLEIGIVEQEQSIANLSKTSYCFRRPSGEKGEVPDWWFRAKYFKNKGYISADEAVDPNKGSVKKPDRSY